MSLLFDAISVITDGSEHQLDGHSPYAYLGFDGLGAAPVSRVSERGAQQHGDTDLGFYLQPRIFTLLLLIKTNDPADFWNQREQLITWFAPYNSPVIRFALKNGKTRDIACHYIGDLAMPDDSDDSLAFVQKVAIQLKAGDPTLYDPEGRSITFGLAGGSDAFEIPTDIPTGIGASTLDQTTAITNNGNWRAYPHRIRITGSITDPVITNTTTGEKLDFTGTTISGSGDYYDIDVRPGRKSVTDQDGVNRVANLTDDSDLGTFHLRPGDNSIQVTGTSVTEETGVEIAFFEHYLGV